MRHRSKWRKRSITTSSTHPSTTFTIHNNNNVLSNLITNTSRLLHSKSTYFYNGWGRIVPTFCMLAFLVGLYFVINPITNNIPEANAEGERLASSLTLSLTGGDASQTTQADAGSVAFRTNTFQVSATSYLNYDIYVSGLSGQSANLTGRDSAQTIGKVAANTATSSFANNTWGYSITTNTAAGSETSLKYNPVPEFSNSVPSALHYNMKEDIENNNYKLAFAALIAPGMPVDHYETNVMLSVVGNPGEIVRDLTGITTMQEMTAEICSKSTEGQSKALIDTRDNKKYWVTKLKDGNCWMTQNLAYNGGGTSRGTNCSGWQDTNTVAQYCSPGHTDGDHASRGNYYSWPAAMNGNTSATGTVQGICPNGWHLPTSNTTAKGSFGGLTTAYGAGNNSAGSTIMRGSPMYFQYSGNAVSGGISNVGSSGYYWSSTPNGSINAYYLYLNSSRALPSDYYSRYRGFSVRCLAN